MTDAESPVTPRRSPRLDSDAHLDPRDRIVAAASRCLAADGLERTSIASIARAAGLSRQTVYNHFSTKEAIVDEAVQAAASEASDRIRAASAHNATAAGFAVDMCIAAIDEFRRNPAISPLITLLEHPDARRRVMHADVIALARHYLEPILDYAPDRAPFLDEMTETYLRFELSLLTIESALTRDPGALRSYLHRVLVPALGLEPDLEQT